MDPGTAKAENAETIGAGELQHRALRGSVWTLLHTVLAAPLAFAVNAVVARVLGPVDYGGLAFLTLALTIATHVSNAGVSDAALQWGAEAAVKGERDASFRILRKAAGFRMLVQLPIMVATVIVLADGDWVIAAILVAGVTLPAAFGSAGLLIFIENRTASGAKLAILSNLLVQTAVLGAALTSEGPTWVWAVRLLAGSILLPLNLLAVTALGRRASLRLALPRGFPPGFWRFGLLTMIGGLVHLLVFSRSEIVVLGWFGDAAAVGLFALAFGVAAQITAPVDALMGPLAPAAAGLISAHPHRAIAGRDRAVRAAAFLGGALLAVATPLLVVALPLLYGYAYEGARWSFFVLAASSCLQSVCNPILIFVSARRQAARGLWLTVAALIVDVVLALSLIPPLGLEGALVANVGGQVTFLCLLVVGEARLGGQAVREVMTPMGSWLVGLLAALVATTVPLLLSIEVWIAAPIAAALGAVVFVMGVRYSRFGPDANDWEAVKRVFPACLARPIDTAARILNARI
ncbi:hypothetical protein DQ237_10380 [Blastococcus sp. TF02-8]|uniref:lipopolysaccharide biosynthesis protein n=1 Tax=Blastococcus sp. TF02-8 TaxID=2250574 RepID=UPI000DE9F0B5|nr:lipopolysaccharide biosynthesis protein [Blastococcus sp. TF02-8]RBY96258.1 hypothetical protein DQ237_10380 [Blastococcus sp. TF02-8]